MKTTRTRYMTKEACLSAQENVEHEIEVLASIPMNAVDDFGAVRDAIAHLQHFRDLIAYDLVYYAEKEAK